MKILLVGNGTRENRGCEAITLSTINLLRQQLPDCEIEILSFNVDTDKYYESEYGVKVSRIKDEALQLRYKIRRMIEHNVHRLPLFLRTILHTRLRPYIEQLSSCDIVLSLGGDNYTDDYGLPIFFWDLAMLARMQSKPFVIWGASVGPFHTKSSLKLARKALHCVTLITARENATIDYLSSIGFNGAVSRVFDSAFALPSKEALMPEFKRMAKTVGFNISPIYHNYTSCNDQFVVQSVRNFLNYIRKNYNVILVPHVVNNNNNNDATYMSQFVGEHVLMADPDYDCRQLKYVISQCEYFIGARTHATIAAISSDVPTLMLGYSLKAKGLNNDLFDHQDIYINASEFNYDSLVAKFQNLVKNEQDYKSIMRAKNTSINSMTRQGVTQIMKLLSAAGTTGIV